MVVYQPNDVWFLVGFAADVAVRLASLENENALGRECLALSYTIVLGTSFFPRTALGERFLNA